MSSRRRSSSSLPAMQRLRASWTRWRRRRTEQRLLRQQAAARQLLEPVLVEALQALAVPMAEAMARLSDRQLETQRWLERLAATQVPLARWQEQVAAKVSLDLQGLQELKDLQLEILQALQPPAEQQLASLLSGPAPLPSSPPSSES